MKPKAAEHGRVAQKRRTRKAIVAAAAELLAHGKTPSLSDVAGDAALGSLTQATIDTALDSVADSDDPVHRIDVMARAVQRDFAATEQQGRTLLRLTVDAPPAKRPADQPVRGYRRIEWIERALAPLREKVDRKKFERLVSALAMVIGWESLIVARDIRALSLEDAEEVSAWAAQTLVRATLAETRARTGKRKAAHSR
jgi:hypothetical protein